MADFDPKQYQFKEKNKTTEIDTQKQSELLKNHINADKNIAGEEPLIEFDQNEEDALLTMKHKEVEENISASFETFSQKQDLVRTASYTYIDKKGRTIQGKRDVPSSKYMKPVLDSLKKLDDLFDKKIDLKDSAAIEKAFLDVSSACWNYLENRKNPYTDEGKVRKQMVQDFHKQLTWESMRFAETIEKIKIGEYETNEETRWSDVLRKVRTTVYDDKNGDFKLTKGGAATSELFIIEDTKTKEKKFFKKHESVPEGTYSSSIDAEKKRLEKEIPDLTATGESQEEIERIKTRNLRRAELLDLLKEELDSKYTDKDSSYIHHTIDKLLRDNPDIAQASSDLSKVFYALELSGDGSAIEASLNKWLKEGLNLLKESAKDPSKMKEFKECELFYLHDTLKTISKNYLSNAIAVKNVKVEEKSELSKRNVASSRLASILGVKDLVTQSRMTEIQINGTKMSGVIMDEAKGISCAQLFSKAEKENVKVMYSPEAIRSLENLQIFDILAGQVDRHRNNYHVTYEFDQKKNMYVINTICGIDNDMCFGKLRYNEITATGQQGYNRIKNFESHGDVKLPFIDYDMAQHIMQLDAEQLSYQMADILSNEEREALSDRLKGVKRAIKKLWEQKDDAKQKKRFLKGDEWNGAEKAIIDDTRTYKRSYMEAYSYYHPDAIFANRR